MGRYGRWLMGGVTLFVLSYIIAIGRGINTWDESWFLQVAYRVASGDVLYRDVFFGATPLSVYITSALVRFFGPEVLVVKAITAVCFVFTAFLCCRIARQLGATGGVPYLLVLALLVYAPPGLAGVGGVYTPLATLFLLASLSAALSWWNSETTAAAEDTSAPRRLPSLVFAGVSAGLCFVSKQNAGVYASVSLLLAVAVGTRNTKAEGSRSLPHFLIVVAAFLLGAMPILSPVWYSGGADKFLDYGFLNRVTYLRVAGVSYIDELKQALLALRLPLTTNDFKHIHWEQHQFFFPPITFVALFVTWLRACATERRRVMLVFFFVGAAFVSAFPRADGAHVVIAVPALCLGLVYAWNRLKPCIGMGFRRLVQAALLLWLGLGLVSSVVTPIARIGTGEYVVSNLPHFRGALIPPDEQARFRAFAATLSDVTAGEPLFFLTPRAGLYYLVSGLRNPTPFDYPLVTAFGRTGEADLIAAISRRQIRLVCLDMPSAWPLAPTRLVRFVTEQMDRGPHLGFCTLYRARAQAFLGARQGRQARLDPARHRQLAPPSRNRAKAPSLGGGLPTGIGHSEAGRSGCVPSTLKKLA